MTDPIKCYFKEISKSTSEEGKNYKLQFRVNFNGCFYCSGYFIDCPTYVSNRQVEANKDKLEGYRTDCY